MWAHRLYESAFGRGLTREVMGCLTWREASWRFAVKAVVLEPHRWRRAAGHADAGGYPRSGVISTHMGSRPTA
jgi:hypothetical protein